MGISLQAFEPDLALTDIALVGGAALADKLGIPKAILSQGCCPRVAATYFWAQLWLRSISVLHCASVDDTASQTHGKYYICSSTSLVSLCSCINLHLEVEHSSDMA